MKQLFYILMILFPLSVDAQNNSVPATKYPQDYFRNPLDIPIFLAGNFGECRPGHFHSGIDIKTLGKENEVVHAAAEGYISRIKMEKGGFGHALYITHPNGYTTLYAHLNDFAPAIQKYVHEVQYERKRWDVDLQILPSQFPVKKGDRIAWSGNTGGSTAPHLHLEIRNTKTEHPLNPQLFGFEIKDTIAPVVKEIAFYKNDFGFYSDWPTLVNIEKKGETYKLAKTEFLPYPVIKMNQDTIFLWEGKYGIGINVDDYMNNSENTITFYTAKLYLDDSLQVQITMDNIGYEEARYINAYTDFTVYGAWSDRHKWIQCFFLLPGNRLNIYGSLNKLKGWLNLTDSQKHKVSIVLTDNNGNESKILFYTVHYPYVEITDMNHEGGGGIDFYANRSNTFNNGSVAFTLDNTQLYDSFYFHMVRAESDGCSEKFRLVGNWTRNIPVHHYFDMKIRPNKNIPAALKNKVVMKYSFDKDEDGRAAAAIDSGWYSAKVRNFGTYWLDIDTIPPLIKSLQKNNANLSKAKQITFEVKDAMTSVKSFSGYLDGKWICFEAHADLIFYKFDDHCPRGKHEMVFRAEDENGNSSTYKMNFTR